MTPTEIRERRLALGLTTADLGRLVGVGAPAIRNWERGDRHPRGAAGLKLEAALLRRRDCTCSCHERPRAVTARAGTVHWTREESDLLRQLVIGGASPDATVDALAEARGYRRTRSAIIHRATQIGCSFYRDQYSSTDVARLLGVTRWRIEQWISRGLLHAERHVSLRTGTASHWWRIERPDVEALVDRHAGIELSPAPIRDRAIRARAEVAAARNRRTA